MGYESCIDDWVNHIFYEVPYSPKGMIYVDQWGTLRHAANVAHVCAQLTAVGLWESDCDTFVKDQITEAAHALTCQRPVTGINLTTPTATTKLSMVLLWEDLIKMTITMMTEGIMFLTKLLAIIMVDSQVHLPTL